VFEENRKKGKGFTLWKHAPYSFSMNNYILTKSNRIPGFGRRTEVHQA